MDVYIFDGDEREKRRQYWDMAGLLGLVISILFIISMIIALFPYIVATLGATGAAIIVWNMTKLVRLQNKLKSLQKKLEGLNSRCILARQTSSKMTNRDIHIADKTISDIMDCVKSIQKEIDDCSTFVSSAKKIIMDKYLGKIPEKDLNSKLKPFNDIEWRIGELKDRINKIYNPEYFIFCCKDGRCLDATWDCASGTKVQLWTHHGSINQKWNFIKKYDNVYEIRSVNSNKYLDVIGFSKDNFAPVHQWDCNSSDNQKWELIRNDDGSYYLKAKHSDKYLSAIEEGGDGCEIIQRDWQGDNNQRWEFKIAT